MSNREREDASGGHGFRQFTYRHARSAPPTSARRRDPGVKRTKGDSCLLAGAQVPPHDLIGNLKRLAA
jgi:hypothetical protein